MKSLWLERVKESVADRGRELLGLRGISFGNFLIKQVAIELAREFPAIKLFSTLSPIPLFKRTLEDPGIFDETRLAAILGDDARVICNAADEPDVVQAIEKLVAEPMEHKDIVSGPLERLGLAYLALVKRGGQALRPGRLLPPFKRCASGKN